MDLRLFFLQFKGRPGAVMLNARRSLFLSELISRLLFRLKRPARKTQI
jgi:hypothetical protein